MNGWETPAAVALMAVLAAAAAAADVRRTFHTPAARPAPPPPRAAWPVPRPVEFWETVWVAAARPGVLAHAPAVRGRTVCGCRTAHPDTGRPLGALMMAGAAAAHLTAVWCRPCFSPRAQSADTREDRPRHGITPAGSAATP